MRKRTPLPCTTENCGDLLPKCGTANCYSNLGCRCDACYAAKRVLTAAYYEENREVLKAKSRRYSAENANAIKRKREQNREEISARRTKRRLDNIDRVLEQERKARARNREDALARTRRWRKRNPDKVAEGSRRWRAENPERNREIKRNGHHRRKARLIEAFVEDVNRIVVFERDGYICQLCGIECSTKVDWPAKNFATLDHIIPLAKGGTHEYANVQLLCLPCNCSKQDRLIG
jgi:5-methylcytosine-specific restriction endonuclease McrA